MGKSLNEYQPIVGDEVIERLRQLALELRGARVVHVNSTRIGGGVAEILAWMVPLMNELGMDASWEVVDGDEPFFHTTKSLHNGLQGNDVELEQSMIDAYDRIQDVNAERLRAKLEGADFVLIHDPQPAGLFERCPARAGKWLWRCHIDASSPAPSVWEMVRQRVQGYDGNIFSLTDFAQDLPGKQFIIPPSIDPLSDKNRELKDGAISKALAELELDAERPIVTQVSRFDRFKDPVGVIRAFGQAAGHEGAQLVLAGGGATDDPEGEAVLAEVREAARSVANVHVLMLPGDAHVTINALQRASAVIVQKSLREGFGLTVTEGLWKGRPVIGGDTGGIRLQILDGETGYLVSSPEQAAERIGSLLADSELADRLGRAGREHVRQQFLLTRELTDHLDAMIALK